MGSVTTPSKSSPSRRLSDVGGSRGKIGENEVSFDTFANVLKGETRRKSEVECSELYSVPEVITALWKDIAAKSVRNPTLRKTRLLATVSNYKDILDSRFSDGGDGPAHGKSTLAKLVAKVEDPERAPMKAQKLTIEGGDEDGADVDVDPEDVGEPAEKKRRKRSSIADSSAESMPRIEGKQSGNEGMPWGADSAGVVSAARSPPRNKKPEMNTPTSLPYPTEHSGVAHEDPNRSTSAQQQQPQSQQQGSGSGSGYANTGNVGGHMQQSPYGSPQTQPMQSMMVPQHAPQMMMDYPYGNYPPQYVAHGQYPGGPGSMMYSYQQPVYSSDQYAQYQQQYPQNYQPPPQGSQYPQQYQGQSYGNQNQQYGNPQYAPQNAQYMAAGQYAPAGQQQQQQQQQQQPQQYQYQHQHQHQHQ